MARNPFEFLDTGSRERTMMLLLLAIIRKSGGELELSLEDVTGVSDGDSFLKYTADTPTRLVLRFARKGAEAFFLQESEPSRTSPSPTRAVPRPSAAPVEFPPPPTPLRAPVIHDDLDLALREEAMAQEARAAARKRTMEARAQSGSFPWRTVRPQ